MSNVTIYIKPTCPYCHRAMALLDSKGVNYTVIDVQDDAELFHEMVTKSGRRTVPQIFINNKAIGGCDDLHALDADGKLDPLLEQD